MVSFSNVDWYEELQEIRERLLTGENHLHDIREFAKKDYISVFEVPDYDLLRMTQTLLLSYPVLSKKHLGEWECFRKVVCEFFESDKERCTTMFEICSFAVFSDKGIENLRHADHPYSKEFYQPFDYLDVVKTLKENKEKMPFKMLNYDDARLELVAKTIQTFNIRKWIAAWLEYRLSRVYPEVLELYKNHSEDCKWYP